ncbi:hypothetical protein AWW70_27505 [Bacillus mycoides]|uniref:Uncharacterized protein n=1 Tax=Bacillus mycoides TaxID=1405 RepID=A0A109FRY5_BACMY|nr:hypothetical protein [Bacillus mycoides]KWU53457.1 hypothetical protein AWW70_27505 [Bacillus mycoides]
MYYYCKYCDSYEEKNHKCCKGKSKYYNGNKKDEGCNTDCDSNKKKSKLVGFAYDTSFSIINLPLSNSIVVSEELTTVAEVTLQHVKAGDLVWLNGLFHINNNSSTTQDLITAIYRVSGFNRKLIYQSIIEIDFEPHDDVTQVVAQHVDQIGSSQEEVSYILTVSTNSPTAILFVNGPITFTAAEISL